jgi:hypothetical protein
MKKELDELIEKYEEGNMSLVTLKSELLRIFGVSKRHLLKSILEDMDGKHSEYHREVVEGYLDDVC